MLEEIDPLKIKLVLLKYKIIYKEIVDKSGLSCTTLTAFFRMRQSISIRKYNKLVKAINEIIKEREGYNE